MAMSPRRSFVAAFQKIVAGFSGKTVADAEAAWAEQRPTLLLFAASW